MLGSSVAAHRRPSQHSGTRSKPTRHKGTVKSVFCSVYGLWFSGTLPSPALTHAHTQSTDLNEIEAVVHYSGHK